MSITKLDTSSGDFESKFKSAVSGPASIVLYSAEWCMSCKVALAHILKPIALSHPNLNLLYVYTPTSDPDSAPREQFPLFELYQTGGLKDSALGANRQTKDKVNSWAQQYGKQASHLSLMMKLAMRIQNRLIA
jgi:hypothetical protein